MKKIIISIIILFAISLGGFAQTVFYVSGSVSSSGDGSSWGNAFKTIQEGIDAAYNSLTSPSIETAQVWVKQGTYYIYNDASSNSVSMKEGVEIYGGFVGNETHLNQRNFNDNVTILNGHKSEGSTEQVSHVVSAYGVEISTDVWNDWTNGKIDGFTITGGKIAGGPPINSIKATDPESILSSGDQSSGAGVLFFKSAPSISNCIIDKNDAGKGGGIYIMTATKHPQTDMPVANVSNCTISNNTAIMRGGGLSVDLCQPVITNTRFLKNTCNAKGGGAYIDWICPQVVFINCLFAENSALRAGAVGIDGSSSPVFINCTVTNNHTTDVGAGLYTGSYNPSGTDSNEPVLINCIVSGNSTDWGGAVDLRIWHDDYFHVSYSALGEGFTSKGEGVIYDSPTYNNIEAGDYSLADNSVGIDAGVYSDTLLPSGIQIPTTDIDGNQRDSNPDMGCFEYSTSGIFETNVDNELHFDLYPNPVSDVINISPEDSNVNKYEIIIYDNLGKMIIQKIATATCSIDVSDFATGIYFVKFVENNSITTQKFIVR